MLSIKLNFIGGGTCPVCSRLTTGLLVGISPNGLLTFVSKLWSGRVTDKVLGLLDMLDYGDNAMVDRGFDRADLFPDGVLLNIPSFKGSRPQLTAEETEDTVGIAAVGIHIESATGRVKTKIFLMELPPAACKTVPEIPTLQKRNYPCPSSCPNFHCLLLLSRIVALISLLLFN